MTLIAVYNLEPDPEPRASGDSRQLSSYWRRHRALRRKASDARSVVRALRGSVIFSRAFNDHRRADSRASTTMVNNSRRRSQGEATPAAKKTDVHKNKETRDARLLPKWLSELCRGGLRQLGQRHGGGVRASGLQFAQGPGRTARLLPEASSARPRDDPDDVAATFVGI